MIVAGVGCRKNTPSEVIESAIDAALGTCGLARDALHALATARDKANEPGLIDVAKRWDLQLIAIEEAAMVALADRALTASARVQALKGVPSVAETTALAAAGRNARLLCARSISAGAACAIATGDGP